MAGARAASPSSGVVRVIAAALWLVTLPLVGGTLVWRLHVVESAAGIALIAFGLPAVLGVAVGIALGWRMRAVALGLGTLLVSGSLLLLVLSLIARGM